MAWFLLLIAGLVEVVFVMSLAHPGSFKRLWPTVCVLFFGLFSLYLLALAMRWLPVGTAFAVWAAIGAAGAAILSMAFRGESASWLRIGGLATVIAGTVVLRLAGG